MTGLYFAFLGDYAMRLVNFYRANQAILNGVILAYGLLLTAAHRNVVRIERLLRERMDESDMHLIWRRLEAEPLGDEELSTIRKRLRIPVLASPLHFFFYPVSRETILRILRKKYPRSNAP